MNRRGFLRNLAYGTLGMFLSSNTLSANNICNSDYSIDFRIKTDSTNQDYLQRACLDEPSAIEHLGSTIFRPVVNKYNNRFNHNTTVFSSIDNSLSKDGSDCAIHYCQHNDLFNEVFQDMGNVFDFYTRNSTLSKDKVTDMKTMYKKTIDNYSQMNCEDRFDLYNKLFMAKTNDCTEEAFKKNWEEVWMSGFKANINKSGGLTDAANRQIFIFGDLNIQKYLINKQLQINSDPVVAFSTGINQYLKYCAFLICHELGHMKGLSHGSERFLDNGKLNIMYPEIITGGSMDLIMDNIVDCQYGYPSQ